MGSALSGSMRFTPTGTSFGGFFGIEVRTIEVSRATRVLASPAVGDSWWSQRSTPPHAQRCVLILEGEATEGRENASAVFAVPSVLGATGILGLYGRWGHDLGARCTSGGGRGPASP